MDCIDMADRKLPGLNVQAPWARQLLDGTKTIETRTYPLPAKYRGQVFWLIETPGRNGRFKARIIGTISFSECRYYETASAFYADTDLHLVHPGVQEYAWRQGAQKFGWIVESVEKVEPFDAPTPRGIIYARPFDKSLRSQ